MVGLYCSFMLKLAMCNLQHISNVYTCCMVLYCSTECSTLNILHLTYYLALVATVGFDASHYGVREDEGEVEVCVVVQPPVTIAFPFQLMFSAAIGDTGYMHTYVLLLNCGFHCIPES